MYMRMGGEFVEESLSGLGPDSDLPLTRSIVRYFTRRGGRVRIDPSAGNFIRRTLEVNVGGVPTFDIEVQGVPNLVHEFVHAIQAGRLDDDHGFDYGSIPLDLERAEHRRYLWEELACCVISCACLPHCEQSPAGRRERMADPADGWEKIDLWFAEQFEIQGIFHGLEENMCAFRRRIDDCYRRWKREADTIEVEAYRLFERAINENLREGERLSVFKITFSELWSRYCVSR